MFLLSSLRALLVNGKECHYLRCVDGGNESCLGENLVKNPVAEVGMVQCSGYRLQ